MTDEGVGIESEFYSEPARSGAGAHVRSDACVVGIPLDFMWDRPGSAVWKTCGTPPKTTRNRPVTPTSLDYRLI